MRVPVSKRSYVVQIYIASAVTILHEATCWNIIEQTAFQLNIPSIPYVVQEHKVACYHKHLCLLQA